MISIFRVLFAILLVPVLTAPAPVMAESKSEGEDPNAELRKHSGLKILCRQAVTYIPWDDVEYEAGIDQKGNFVVAADIGVTFSPYDYPIDIPLQLDLLKKFNMNVPLGIIAEADVAGMKIHQDGHVEYNGQNVTPEIETFCKDIMLDHAAMERLEAKKAKEEKAAEERSAAAPPPGIQREALGEPVHGEAH